ncbi:MAG: sigma 54-interacting transcriptional regulator [Bacteroidetes bacterium]|nr:sigma 54-interacting transcriptional regulator [Bacteroidota bacterium]
MKPESRDPNEMLRIISEGTAAVVGGDFFRSLAYHVIASTGIRYAIVTECADLAKSRVRTLVYIERDQFLDNFEYELVGTPCEIVMRGENYYCVADLDILFPKEKGIKSYFGVPIFLSNGEVIGHIAIFDTVQQSFDNNQLNILKIFASRAGAEIERKRKDDIIKANMVRYKNIFDFSPVGLCEEDFSEVKIYIEKLKAERKADLKTIFDIHPEEISKCWSMIKRIRVNNAQLDVFEVNTEDEYAQYMRDTYMPAPAKGLLLTLEGGEMVFERETEIISAKGQKKSIKVKRIVLPENKNDWSRSLISCVDITNLKRTQYDLKSALDELQLLKEKLEAENIYLQQEIKHEHNFEEIISSSAVFKKVLSKISQVADTDATVLILGESGTGKELIARAIHSVSKRGNRPLVKVNCAALPANLIESELFGHEKGAFTGAIAQKIGRFELAHEGTIFLDEIGEMPLDLQSKLLRVLQEGEFERVGSSKTIKIDVRVIAATNRELQESVNNKEFRSDLYYRLNVFPISSPPLRERREDIPLLVNHFCKKHGMKIGRKITSITKQALDSLMEYDWPGNVRELENIIERAVIISTSNVLELGEWRPVNSATTQMNSHPAKGEPKKSGKLEEVEREHILETLKKVNWKIRGEDGAAKILELNPTTLEARMKKLGILRPK